MSKRAAPDELSDDEDWDALHSCPKSAKWQTLAAEAGPSSSGASSPDTVAPPPPATPPTPPAAFVAPTAAPAPESSSSSSSGSTALAIIPSHDIYRVDVPATGETNPVIQLLAGLPIYVGRATSLSVRCGQHRRIVASSANIEDRKKLYQLLPLMNGNLKDMMRRVDGLPHGVPAHLAREMEMYYIRKLGTMYDPADEVRQHMCNLNVGDPTRDQDGHKVYMTKQRYDELEKMIEEGFPEPSAWSKAPELAKQNALIELMEDALEDETVQPALREKLVPQLAEANECRALLLVEKAEYEGTTGFRFPTDTPFFYVRQLLSHYASMEPTAMVSRKDLQSELHCDMIQNMAQNLNYEEKIAKILKRMYKSFDASMQENSDRPLMPVKEACAVLTLVSSQFGALEEQILEEEFADFEQRCENQTQGNTYQPINPLKRAKEWRAWILAHGGKVPKTNHAKPLSKETVRKEEFQLGKQMSTWKTKGTEKRKRPGGSHSHANVYLTILRDVDAFWTTVDRTGAGLSGKIRRARDYLAEGYAFPRVAAEGRFGIPQTCSCCGSMNATFSWLNSFFGSKARQPQSFKHLDNVLQDLDKSDPAYAARIRAVLAAAKATWAAAHPASSSDDGNDGNDDTAPDEDDDED